ncbi:MAG: diguanylate cyclase domain-containing protein, partial [Acidobacteriota bacterium]
DGLNLRNERSRSGNRLTVSIGAASAIPREETHRTALIAASDRALYEAKRSGRHCVRMADPLSQP